MKLYATIEGERKDKLSGKTIERSLGENEYIRVNIQGEEGIFLASLTLKIGTDYVGELITADIDFRDDIYVNGKHWLDAEVSDKVYIIDNKAKD